MEKERLIGEFKNQFGKKYSVYDESFISKNNDFFLLAKDDERKYFFILGGLETTEKYAGEVTGTIKDGNNILYVKKGDRSYDNIKKISGFLSFLKPVACGLKTSFGSGDRLGIVTPAHIRAFEKHKSIFPFLCQQSVRELHKRPATWEQVMGDTLWGIFESGYKGTFGADADHIKEIEDLYGAIETGYSMFTIDPSDYISDKSNNNSNKSSITEAYEAIPGRKEIEKMYLGKKYKISQNIIEFTEETLPEVAVSFAEAIKHVQKCYEFIKKKKKEPFDFEVSMDETENPISPLGHIFISNELQRNDVNFHNMALRFPGEWQKAIDFKGDIQEFQRQMKMHADIARMFGGYKLSLHSGSEKFSTYNIFSEETKGLFHVKTSGTSWLESIRTIAVCDPLFFQGIYNFAASQFEEDKKSYSISADVADIPLIKNFAEKDYKLIFEIPACRQMLHVTFGSILNKKEDSVYVFKDRIYKCLLENEETHYELNSANIEKHLDLLNS